MTGEGPPQNRSAAAFGRFHLQHQIGAGSLGPVFRAADRMSETPVVIKVLRLRLTPARAHAVTEALAALQDRIPAHPGIVPLVKVGVHDAEPFLVSAFMPGQSVDVAAAAVRPPVAEVLPRLVQVAAGLDFCADASIWHGALHPHDVLVSAGNTAVIGVGIAQVLEQAGVTLPVRRPYTAPEIVAGAPTSPRADQFALAVIAYEWLYGVTPPLPLDGPWTPPARAGVDRAAMADVFTSALASAPARRFESSSAFVAALADGIVRRSRPGSLGRVAEPAPAPLTCIVPQLPDPPVPPATWHRADGVTGAAAADLSLDAGTPPPLSVLSDVPPARGRRWLAGAAALVLAAAVGIAVGFWSTREPEVVPAAHAAPPVPPPIAAARPAHTAPPPAAVGDAADDDDGAGTAGPADVLSVASAAAPSARSASPAAASPAPSAPAAPSVAGRLVIRSTPAGARVTVDGRDRGRTPLALGDLAWGAHAIAISRDGYTAQVHEVALSADRPARALEVSLAGGANLSGGSVSSTTIPAPGATRGGVRVESRPVGATVFLDGRAVGVAPLTLDDLRPGPHALRLERRGYHAWGTTVHVVAGELARLAASLAGGQDNR